MAAAQTWECWQGVCCAVGVQRDRGFEHQEGVGQSLPRAEFPVVQHLGAPKQHPLPFPIRALRNSDILQ